MKNKICIVIVGPTAVGKTPLALELAQHFNTEIISADSRQCFKELNIGVAKPSPADLQKIKHHFINSYSVTDEVNAKVFEAYALEKIAAIFNEHDTAVMAGGTGLYVKAFCEGIDEIPVIDPKIRNVIVTNYNNSGYEWLREEVEKNDPQYFSKGEIKNPQRMIRALEVKLSTGRSIVEFHSKEKQKRNFTIIKTGLELPKELLYQNINNRVDSMMANGLLEEVKNLSSFKHLNALQTVGYKELFDHLDGKNSLEAAIEKIKLNTRHYAKRQMTWFKKDKEVKWFNTEDSRSIISSFSSDL
jgi:tRNA dimethylallyltransferase